MTVSECEPYCVFESTIFRACSFSSFTLKKLSIFTDFLVIKIFSLNIFYIT